MCLCSWILVVVVFLMKWVIWFVLDFRCGCGILFFWDILEVFFIYFLFFLFFVTANAGSQHVSNDVSSKLLLLVLIQHFLFDPGVKSQLDYLQQCLPGNFLG